MRTIWVVRNSNGATPGDFMTMGLAERCRRVWERRYERSGMSGTVRVIIYKALTY